MRSIISAWVVSLAATSAWAELPPPVKDSDFPAVNPAEAELGQLLFYDPILAGNREVACATCHHPKFGTSDGLSLGLGDGGIGLGTARVPNPDNHPEQRIPRNAQSLWNVAAQEYQSMFHDGRVEFDAAHTNGMRTPLEDDMMQGFASILSAQTMFPVLSPDEMAGHYSENEVAKAIRIGVITGPGGAWDLISRRVASFPDYVERFKAVYPHIQTADDIGFTDISNAVAVFIGFEFRSDTSPFDAFLRGTGDLTAEQTAGMEIFYGQGGCSACHSGPLQTDHDFHAMGEPQLGPGKAARFETHARDEGRFRVTNDPADMYAFRTPSLRNVALTAPYGHAGSHADLAAFIAAHANPAEAIFSYDRGQAVLPEFGKPDWWAMDRPEEVTAIAASVTTPAVVLSEADIAALVAFLGALTDPVAITGRLGVPEAVPSGLTIPNP